MNHHRHDLITGIVLLIFSIIFYVLTYRFSGYELEKIPGDVGPAMLPRLLLAALALGSIYLILVSLREHRKRPANSIKLKPLIQPRPFVMFGAFLVYIYLATLFGYIVSTIAFMVIGLSLLGVRTLWLLILIPPAITLVSYYLFGAVLDIYLPAGSLF